ncbi:MAG: hypothetical protein WEB58_02630 [Planctomycetaceae bacterium]
MLRPAFFKNPEYCEYVRLLVRLHDLIIQKKDESEEGDRLRDEMDLCSKDFTDEEVVSLNGISGDIYFLSLPSIEPTQLSDDARKELVLAKSLQRSGDYISALAILRKFRFSVASPILARLRGTIFSEAGLHDVAWRFYKFAAEREPENDSHVFVELDALHNFDPANADERAKEILCKPESYAPMILLKAIEIRIDSSRNDDPKTRGDVNRKLLPLIERVISDFEAEGSTKYSPDLLPMAYSLCGFCFQDEEMFPEARRCFDQALMLDKYNAELFTARGMLLYGRDTDTAVDDFKKAIAIESSTEWPFFFLAHHFLLQNRFDVCLQLCREVLKFPTTDKVRAHCYEWMAISEAMLRSSPVNVRTYFDRALQLSPHSERLQRNRQAYDTLIKESNIEEIHWEKDEEAELREFGRPQFRPQFRPFYLAA